MRTSLKTLTTAGAALCLALGSAAPALADTGLGGTADELVGVVRITSPTTAEVQAQYRCYANADTQLHLWVSVKQAADGSADPRLANPGSGGGTDENGNPIPGVYTAATWVQSHAGAAKLQCDGHTHVAKFAVDQSEQGYGTLRKGEAWVQFCLFDANNQQAPVSSMEFLHVR